MVGIWSAETFFLHLPMLGDRSCRVGSLFPPFMNIMAISNSIALGRASGSIGNVTLRNSKGRTIASRKRGGRPITRAGIPEREFVFGLINRFAGGRKADIEISFAPTKYGTPRNAFVKYNYSALYAALAPLYMPNIAVFDITDAQISAAVADYAIQNPTAIFRVKMGSNLQYLTGEWPANVPPVPALVLPFSIGGVDVMEGVNISISNVGAGAIIRIPVANADLLTSPINGASLVYGGETLALANVSLKKEGARTYVEGSLPSAIAVGNYATFGVTVDSVDITNALSVANVSVVEPSVNVTSVTVGNSAFTNGKTLNVQPNDTLNIVVEGEDFTDGAISVTYKGSQVPMTIQSKTRATGSISASEGTYPLVISWGGQSISGTVDAQAL